MYVVLAVISFFIFWAASGFGQKRDADLDRVRKHRELREKIHQKMLENLMQGTHDESLFGELEKLMQETTKDLDSISAFSFSSGQSVETQWQESSEGRTLLITPPNKDQKLDLSVTGGMVTIKGHTESSQFQNSFSIPQDCDGEKVKIDQKGGKIVMFFPWISTQKIVPKKLERIPLPKSKTDVAI